MLISSQKKSLRNLMCLSLAYPVLSYPVAATTEQEITVNPGGRLQVVLPNYWYGLG